MKARVIKHIFVGDDLVLPFDSILTNVVDESKNDDTAFDYSGDWSSPAGTYNMCVNYDEIEFIEEKEK